MLEIVMPSGALGPDAHDTILDTILRQIAVAASINPQGEWAEKYGTNFENDVFMMHSFCWCDDNNCPWCVLCECPLSAWDFYIDDILVSEKEYHDFFPRNTPQYNTVNPDKWMKIANEINKRRKSVHTPVCSYCTGKLHDGKFGTPAIAPNFWHKHSGLMVNWYKYIGRDVELRGPELTHNLLHDVIISCLDSLSVKGGPY